MGDGQYGIDVATVHRLGSERRAVAGCRGLHGDRRRRNFPRTFRCRRRMDRASADYMGMLATIMNLWRCKTGWNAGRTDTGALTIPMTGVCDIFAAPYAMEKARVVILPPARAIRFSRQIRPRRARLK